MYRGATIASLKSPKLTTGMITPLVLKLTFLITHGMEKSPFSVIPVKQVPIANTNMAIPKKPCNFRYNALDSSGNLGKRKPKNP